MPPGQEGTYAEKVAIKAAVVAKKPDSLSHVNAAALALIGLTAHNSVEDTLKLKRGETILVQGGAGGVASYAIQLAKHIGARVITTTSVTNLDYVRSLGADQAIDYGTEDFTKIGQVCDAVFETVGGDVAMKSFAVLKPGGRAAFIASGGKAPEPPRPTCSRCVRRCRAPAPRWSASRNCSPRARCARPRSSSTRCRRRPTRTASARAGTSAASWCSRCGEVQRHRRSDVTPQMYRSSLR